MKILTLNYEFPPIGGGAAPVSRDIAIQMAALGHEVTVVTMGFANLPEYEDIENVKIYRLKCLRRKKNVCKPWEQFTYLMAVRSFMKQHMRNHSYDMCHAHFVIPTGEVARWIKQKYNIPYIITAHGSDVEGHNKKITMKIMHRFLRNGWRRIVKDAEYVVSPSKYLLELMEHNYSAGRYEYIPNGINLNKYLEFKPNEKKIKQILIMGRLQKFKGVQDVLQAFSKIDLKDWRVEILGDGPYKRELEKLTADLGLYDKVKFRGWIDNGSTEQLQFLRKSAIYISASRFENCPMSVIEAIAMGCHVLLSDIPGHKQLIEGENHFFTTDNPQELIDILGNLIEGQNILENESNNVKKYDWCFVINQYERLCESSLKKYEKL